ncbi:MAG: carbohydrate binding domain-containing protein [Bacteroidetes bacterium]|nr:carbohydrate binding domain-containing protein [Bacteroidota bacterium]
MKRIVCHFVLFVMLAGCTAAITVANAQPLVDSFPFTIPSYDSTYSDWLPAMPVQDVDSLGFLHTSPDGHLAWADGSRARFVGANLIASACFPDSATAILAAGHMRKLGINMVRFVYFDYHNSDGATTLAPGNRSDSLSPSQMKRLDWFLYQLRRNGIHVHFVLKARNGPRRDDGVPGWDSTYNYGQYITYFSEPMQAMQRRYMAKLFTHLNPYTAKRYADDPEIALVTITDQNSIYDAWINDRLNQRAGYLSFYHSRLLDTLFTGFLVRRHGTTANLKAAYWEGSHTLGPNTVKNPGFESFTDNWNLNVGEGAQASPVIIQGPEVAPGQGTSSLRVVVRKVNGTESRLYLDQQGVAVHRNGVYHLQFRAKTDSASGRQIHIVLMRGSAPNDNFGLNELPMLTNAWQTFDFTFRSLGTDSIGAILRLYLGKQMGDVFLDGFVLEETGRDGLLAGEALENATVSRAKFRDAAKLVLARMYDQVDFYDSLGRAYYRTMRDHLRSLGVKAMIAGTNNSGASADSWIESEYDFTSETAQWDFNGARPGSSYSDSTWVIRNYSVLNYRDQKIPEFSRNAMVGKPFIAESYLHVYPNAHRPEMMLFFPSYASLHDWDGAYFYCYSDRSAEMGDRRRFIKDDFTSFIGDPSICALLPQVSAALRNGWIAPAQRTVKIQFDAADTRYLPVTYSSRGGSYNIEGTFQNVANLVSAVRADSFNASRHYTADDYYVTIPSDDNVQSDTREITLDITKGILQLNTPHVQGGAGAINATSAIRTDNLGVSWIDGGRNVAYLWTPLDGNRLDSARRSLLTITTRALNAGAVWQYGDSSLGKNWGAAPILMESAKLGINFYTAADSVVLYPLDSLGRTTGRAIPTVLNSNGSFRATLDLRAEGTPWFGVESFFGSHGTTGVPLHRDGSASVGEAIPTPASDAVVVEIVTPPNGARVGARLCDMLGRVARTVPEHDAVGGRSHVELDLRGIPGGSYVCVITINGMPVARRVVVER